MFKVKVKTPRAADIAAKVKKTVDEAFAYEVHRKVVNDEIKQLIASGTSPVDSREGRRFKGYKNPESYPGKRKEKRPVSLWLTGEMLNWYQAWKVNGLRLRIGIHTNAPEDVKIRAVANNEGVPEKNISARRFIPMRGETYRISIIRKLKELYAKKIKSILSK